MVERSSRMSIIKNELGSITRFFLWMAIAEKAHD
jgi:hypothetical protein